MTASMSDDSLLGTALDVAALAAMVESSGVAIFAVAEDGAILSWNDGAWQLFGYAAADVIGQSVIRLAPADAAGDWERLLQWVRDAAPAHRTELKAVRWNGVELDLSITISPIRQPNLGVRGSSIVAMDVTEQKWIARTLESTLASLEQAVKETRESERRYRRLTGDAAHQLRTPITGIRACTEALLDNPPLAEREELLGELIREASRAAKLMTGLFHIAALDEGRELRPVRCDLVRLCEDEAERARGLSPSIAVRVTSVGDGEGRPEVDPHAMREIVANLLDNARRHAAGEVQIVIEASGDPVVIRVSDDGAGVPAALQDRIFERFVTLDGHGGSGLGLPIARDLARAHGGDLSYEDRAFVVRLPARSQRRCGGAGEPNDDIGRDGEVAAEWTGRRTP